MWTQTNSSQKETHFTNSQSDFRVKTVRVVPVNSNQMCVQFSFGIISAANAALQQLKNNHSFDSLETTVLASSLTVTLTSKKQIDLFRGLLNELNQREPELASLEDTLIETIINTWTPSAVSRFWTGYHSSRSKDPGYAAKHYVKFN